MSEPYGLLQCEACDQYVEDMCPSCEVECSECCEDAEHRAEAIA